MRNWIRLFSLVASLALVATQASGQASSPLPRDRVFFNFHHVASHSQFEASEFLLGIAERGRGTQGADITWTYRVTNTGSADLGEVRVEAPRGSLAKVVFSLCGHDTRQRFLCANGEEVGPIELDESGRVAYGVTVAVNHLKSKGSGDGRKSRRVPSRARVHGAVTVFDLETGGTQTQIGIDLPVKILVFENSDGE